MDNYVKAIEDRLALERRCLTLFNGNAALKLQLERNILKHEQLRNQLIHARLAAAPQFSTVVPVVPLSLTVDPVPPTSLTVAAVPSATATATTGTAIASTSISVATIQAPQKYPQYILV